VKSTPVILAGVLMALAAASSAGASVLVLGEGLAPACSKAAFRGKADRASVETCTRALAQIDQGIQLGVDEPAKAFYNRAIAQEGLGDAKAAWLDYRKAQSLDPDWDAPAKQLVRFKVETN
jgi:hypothetical protein